MLTSDVMFKQLWEDRSKHKLGVTIVSHARFRLLSVEIHSLNGRNVTFFLKLRFELEKYLLP